MKTDLSKKPLVYLLEHEYTTESLVFGCENLKGNDYKIYSALKASKLPLLLFPSFFTKRVNEGFSDDDFFEEGVFLTISKMYFDEKAILSDVSVSASQVFSFPGKDMKDMKLTKSTEHQTGKYERII